MSISVTITRSFVVMVMALIVFPPACAAPSAPQIKRLSLHVPAGASEVHATGANDHGQVVGWYKNAKGGLQSFLWQKGVSTPLQTPKKARYVQTHAINDRGQIVGDYAQDGADHSHGFLWDHGKWTTLDYPHPHLHGTSANGINDVGQVVGAYAFQNGPVTHTPPAPHGFLWDHGTWRTLDSPAVGQGGTKLSGINNQGQIIGNSTDKWHANRSITLLGFLWNHGVWTPLHGPSGEPGCTPKSIGGRGLVWGTLGDEELQTKFFLQDHGVYYQGKDLDKILQKPKGHDHVDMLLTGGGTIVEVLWDK